MDSQHGDRGIAVLSVRGVSKRYGGVQALESVSLQLRPGEIVALAGENGSGKSTLAKIVAGVVTADEGSVECSGVTLAPGRPRSSHEAGIALVSQELTAIPHMTVAENVLLARYNRPLSRFSLRRAVLQAREYLVAVGVDVDPAATMASLAPGEREMVEVAKAMAARPKVLILDEATARLTNPERLFAVVDALAARGTAVVFITHRLAEIRRLAHRAVVLRDGRVTGELDGSRLSDVEITSLMVGRDLDNFFHKRAVPKGAHVVQVDDLITERAPAPLSLTVAAGEIVGIAGLVGAGRSELLETMMGVRRSRGGTVRINGNVLNARRPHHAIEARMSFVPEDRFEQALVPGASILTNLAMPSWRRYRRTNRRLDRRRAQEAVVAFRIKCPGVTAPVRSLSGGNAQKVVIARCLQQDPVAVLLDEPTRGVDVGARSEIYELLIGCAERGVAVLMASSDLPELIGLCDRIVVMHDGAIVGEVAGAEATEESVALLALGGGRS